MAITYRCAGRHRGVCDYEADEAWAGVCPNCGRLYDCEKRGQEGEKLARTASSALATAQPAYKPTGIENFDWVIGGGIVLGSTLIISGPPGTGKSSLLLAVLDSFIRQHNCVGVFACPEMAKDRTGAYLGRLGISNDNLHVLGLETSDIEKILEFVDEVGAKILVLDSLQKTISEEVEGGVGSPSQCAAVTEEVVYYCGKNKVASIVVSHVNSQGDIAGGTGIQHDVDTLTEFDPAFEIDEDGEDAYEGKVIRRFSVGKNRNGETGRSRLFQMTATGVVGIEEKPKRIVTLEDDRAEARVKRSKLLLS